MSKQKPGLSAPVSPSRVLPYANACDPSTYGSHDPATRTADTFAPAIAPLSSNASVARDRRRSSYVWAPRQIIENVGLGVNAAVVWSELRRLSDGERDGWAVTSLSDLGAGTCLTERAVRAALRRLERAGLVACRSAGRDVLEIRCNLRRFGELCRRWEGRDDGR